MAQSPCRAWEHHSFKVSLWSFQVFWDCSNKRCPLCLCRASKGSVHVEHQGSCRVPRTARAAFIPFCSTQSLSWLRWRVKGCGESVVPAQLCPVCAAAAPAVSWCASPIKITPQLHVTVLHSASGRDTRVPRLRTPCSLSTPRCPSCCKYLAKMLDPRRKSMVWGFVRRGRGQVPSGSLWGLGSITSLPSQPFSPACKINIKQYLPTSEGCLRFVWFTFGNLQRKTGFKAPHVLGWQFK